MRVDRSRARVFTKTSSNFDMLRCEADGLAELARAQCIRVPQVYDVYEKDGLGVLEVEWLDLGRASADVEAQMGRQLAELHRHTAARHGWDRNNWIGLSPQSNQQHDSWVDFYREERLTYQLELARKNGYGGELQEKGARVIERLDDFFEDEPQASLLHGDLWGGNWGAVGAAAGRDHVPVIFDPAVYYGDRETDLAMTRLFGGFGRAFYDAYEDAWPLAPGHGRRLALYQLYHVLNHLNIFGSGYLRQSMVLISELTGE